MVVSSVERPLIHAVFGEFRLRVQHERASITCVEGMPEREPVDDLFPCLGFGCVFHSFTWADSHVRYPSIKLHAVGGTQLESQSVLFVLQVFLAMSAAIGVVAGFMRWADRKLEARIVKEIKDSTYQIQPTSNGGASLKDLHNKVDLIHKDVGVLKSAVLRLETEVRTLEEDVEDLR